MTRDTPVCKVFLVTLFCACSFVSLASYSSAAGEPCNCGPVPNYVLLQGKATGTGHTVCATPYAYGWFGVAQRSHYEKSSTYYGGTRIWKSR